MIITPSAFTSASARTSLNEHFPQPQVLEAERLDVVRLIELYHGFADIPVIPLVKVKVRCSGFRHAFECGAWLTTCLLAGGITEEFSRKHSFVLY